MPRQLGPKGRGDLRTSVSHLDHATMVALPVIASGAAGRFCRLLPVDPENLRLRPKPIQKRR
jgi:hypothetical protein